MPINLCWMQFAWHNLVGIELGCKEFTRLVLHLLQFRHQNWLLKAKKSACLHHVSGYMPVIMLLSIIWWFTAQWMTKLLLFEYNYREKRLLGSQQQTYCIDVLVLWVCLSFCSSLFLFVSSLSQLAVTVSEGNLNLGSPSDGKERSLLSWSIVRLPQAARCGQMNNREKREWK